MNKKKEKMKFFSLEKLSKSSFNFKARKLKFCTSVVMAINYKSYFINYSLSLNYIFDESLI